MMANGWILGLVVLGCGLLIGEITGRLIRSSMSRPRRSAAVRDLAKPMGTCT